MNVSLIKKKESEFTDIYLDLHPVVFSAVYSKVNNVDEAEDICQEVFIRFYNKFEEVENPRKWLYGTLRYVVLEYYNRKKNNKTDPTELFDDISFSYVNGFRDTRLIIEDALESLDIFADEKNRSLFDLVAVHNFSYPKAADLLGLSKTQVRYRYNLIVNEFIQYLNGRGIKSMEEIL